MITAAWPTTSNVSTQPIGRTTALETLLRDKQI